MFGRAGFSAAGSYLLMLNVVKCDTKEEGRAWASELRLPTRRWRRRRVPGNQCYIKYAIPTWPTRGHWGAQGSAEHKAGEIQLGAFGQERAAKLQPTQPCVLRARIRTLSSLDLGGVHKV